MSWDDFERLLCWMVLLAPRKPSTIELDEQWKMLVIQMADRYPNG